ncbi:MAG: amidohydrolase family protein [Chloroflexi bacterium]|nr:amidohydrolase family protein [Chloroflexota bacterium]
MIIDSHVHVWTLQPDRYPWQPVGGYVPTTEANVSLLLDAMDLAGVDRAVLVQPTPYGWNNTYLLDAAREHPERFRVVGLVDPHSSAAPAKLTRLVRDQRAHGVRLNWNLEPVEVWQDAAMQDELWSCLQALGIPVCIQMTPDYIDLAHSMAARYPEVHIVFDHLARPRTGIGASDKEFARFLQLAEHPNCYAKLSGLNYYSRQRAPYRDVWPLLQAAVEAFGLQRCMWGSDFPFVLQHWSYADALQVVQGKLGASQNDLEWILGLTAKSLWW